jgi:hypothetical protein
MIRKHNEEKFSYVVLQKKLKSSALQTLAKEDPVLLKNGEDFWLTDPLDPRLVSADPTPLNIVQRFLDYDQQDTNPLTEELMEEVDFDDYNPPLVRSEYGRILRYPLFLPHSSHSLTLPSFRSPLKKKAHVVMDLCQSDGYLTRTTISKSSAWNIPHFYSAIRKLRWGGIVPALPVSVHDLSAHEDRPAKSAEGTEDTGFHPVLVLSPLARRRPSTTPAVRRDIHPPAKVEKNLFKEGEGPHQRHERNRDARDSGQELYQTDRARTLAEDEAEDAKFYTYSDMPRNSEEDAELEEMLKDETEDFELMSKYSKTIDAMRKDERLIGRQIDDPEAEDITQVSDHLS